MRTKVILLRIGGSSHITTRQAYLAHPIIHIRLLIPHLQYALLLPLIDYHLLVYHVEVGRLFFCDVCEEEVDAVD